LSNSGKSVTAVLDRDAEPDVCRGRTGSGSLFAVKNGARFTSTPHTH
jgi:hypothetical protein